MKSKCVIIDDEPLARNVIKNLLENFENIELVKECKNAIQAFEYLKLNDVDLIFLDIEMPQMTGLEFLKNIDNPPEVIITTAYRDYAVESFDFNVVDYLLKPISLDRFLKAISRFYEKRNIVRPSLTKNEDNYIYVKENKVTNKILLNDVIFIESMKEYIKIHTENRTITTKSSLGKFVLGLPSNQFIRVHNSYVISLNEVVSFSTTAVTLRTGAKFPISRSYRNEAVKKLNVSSI